MNLRATRATPDLCLLSSDMGKQILCQQERGQVSDVKEGMQVPVANTASLLPGRAVSATK